jgi:hypothetical protein
VPEPTEAMVKKERLAICSYCQEPLRVDGDRPLPHSHRGSDGQGAIYEPWQWYGPLAVSPGCRGAELAGQLYEALAAVMAPGSHSYMASTFRNGKSRHQACRRCDAEEKADLALAAFRASGEAGPDQ